MGVKRGRVGGEEREGIAEIVNCNRGAGKDRSSRTTNTAPFIVYGKLATGA